MGTNNLARLVDDFALALAQGALEEPLGVTVCHKANVVGVGLVADAKPTRGGLGPHLRLRLNVPEGKHCARQLVRPHHGQHIGLILGGVGRPMQFTDPVATNDDACVVAGGDGVEAQSCGTLKQRVELDVLVAPNARIGGAALRIFAQEVGDDQVVELVAQVPHVVGDAEFVRGTARIVAVLHRAAAARSSAVFVAIAAQCHVDADHLVPGVDDARGSDGGIDSA